MNRHGIVAYIICFIIIFTLTGCAKYPTTPVQSSRQLIITLTVRGQIEPEDTVDPSFSRHYFIAIDNDNDPNTGPLAAFYPPYGGTGWVTSEDAQDSIGLTSFIQYDTDNPLGYIYGVLSGSYFLNRTSPLPIISAQLLDGGSSVRFVIDFSQLATDDIPADDITQLNINFITTNALPTGSNQYVEGREIDGLGPSGQEYITIPTTTDQIFQDDDEDSPNLVPSDPDLDIIHWQVEVQTVSSG